ncbi:MAG: 6-phosphogluconolactonase [Longimicrobiales bacterium]
MIDIGGTHVKVLATAHRTPREVRSGPAMTPEVMVAAVKRLTGDWTYDVVSIGYPGVVAHDRPVAEPHNLGSGWVGFDFGEAFGRPARVINDAALQALGSYRHGRMLYLGLGTGLGSTLVIDGVLAPMELAHLPYRKGRTFEDYVGIRGLERLGEKRWRRHVARVIALLKTALQADDIVVGGGNAKRLKELPPGARCVDNGTAFIGGFRMWDERQPEGAQKVVLVEVHPTADALMRAAAEVFVRCAIHAIRARGRFAVALSGGATPKGLYELLASDPYRASLDWELVEVFWSDERCVPPDDPASNYRLARESLLDHLPVPEANVHRIHGEDDPTEAAANYERALRAVFATPEGPPRREPGGHFDLALLGLGEDGHTASLFPGTAAIHERTRWAVAHYVAALSTWRVTLTLLAINAAANVAFLVSGRDKAKMLRQVTEGPYRPDLFPAQMVAPREGRLRWLVDHAAASLPDAWETVES